MKTLIWYTSDLRTHDHQGLRWAVSQSQEIVALYVFDENTPAKGPRLKFIQESLNDLAFQLNKLNIKLLIFDKNQHAEACQFIQSHKIDQIVTAKAYNFRKKLWQKSIENLFSNINFHYFSTDTLLTLENYNMTFQDVPDIFTSFRKLVEKNWIVAPLSIQPESFDNKFSIASEYTAYVLNNDNPPDGSFKFTGGTHKGQDRINHYIWNSNCIVNYKQTRNGMIEFDDSSKFSPWLSLGCISAKEIYWNVKDFEKQHIQNESTYWLIFELLWRDYFKFLAEKHQQKFFLPSGLSDKLPNELLSSSSMTAFEKWKAGQTEDPFINANMIELLLTGWMSNRGRQNTANYLAKNLKIDWTWGAKWFEENLIDYDCESNWGNWLYQSGFGNDPRNRIFDPQKQALQYDPLNCYQTKWLKKRELL